MATRRTLPDSWKTYRLDNTDVVCHQWNGNPGTAISNDDVFAVSDDVWETGNREIGPKPSDPKIASTLDSDTS